MTLSTVRSLAAVTSAKSINSRTARLAGTTRTSLTWRPGSGPGWSRSCTKNRWCSKRCIRQRGHTSERHALCVMRYASETWQRGFDAPRTTHHAPQVTRMRVTLQVWRQPGPDVAGVFRTYLVDDISPDMSFLEMLD